MTSAGPIHWHEGLLLQPHHLQAFQRHVADREAASRRLEGPPPRGVVRPLQEARSLGDSPATCLDLSGETSLTVAPRPRGEERA